MIRAEVWLTGVTVTVYRWVLRFMPLLAEGRSPKEVLRCLKRQLSDAVYRCLLVDQQRWVPAPTR